MRSLDEATRGLPREVAPRRNLWPLLERRARRRDRNRALARWGGAVAGVLILAALPAGLLWRNGAAAGSPLERAQADYQRARTSLLRALESQSAQVDPAAVRMVRRDLETVDQDLAELSRTALVDRGREGRLVAVTARYERDARLLTDTARLLQWKE